MITEDLTGKIFNRITVLKRSENHNSQTIWLCRCICGKELLKRSDRVKLGTGCRLCSQIDLSGTVVGSLTVIGRNKNNRILWDCKCICGNIIPVRYGHITSKHKTGCSRKCRYKDMTGFRYGFLKVIGRAIKDSSLSSYGQYWRCKCKCGRVIIKATRSLKRGLTCGCYQRLEFGEASFNSLYWRYVYSARARDLHFGLNKDQVRNIFKMKCDYCGCAPSQQNRANNSLFIYNGIDRVNPDEGYTVKNCVACCKTCNTRKGKLSLKEFKTWIKAVHSNLF